MLLYEIFKKIRSIFLAGIASILLMSSPQTAAIDLIAHPGIKSDALTSRDIRALFTMRKKQWPDGTPTVVYVLDDKSELHNRFCKEKLAIFPYKLRRIWDRLTFSGTGNAPITASSEDDMFRLVSSTPGAIGYVNDATNNGTDHVQVIKIR